MVAFTKGFQTNDMDKKIPFTVIDWNDIPASSTPGSTGESLSRILQYPGLRIRMVQYSPGYLADHRCQKGHVIHCLRGSFVSELETGEKSTFNEGMSYIVSDNASSHRSSTVTGCTLLIIDGDFLKDV